MDGALRAVLMLLLLACRPEPLPREEPPDLILLLLNGLQGEERVEAALEEGLGEGWAQVRFHAAYAQSTSRELSLASVLTGRYVSAIPVCRRRPPESDWCSSIPQDRPLLPQVLALYGYQTALLSDAALDLAQVGWGYQEVIPNQGSLVHWWNEHSEAPRFLTIDLGAVDFYAKNVLAFTNRPRPLPIEAQEVPRVGGEAGRWARDTLGRLPAGPRPRLVVLTSLQGVSLDERLYPALGGPSGTTPEVLSETTLRVPLLLGWGGKGRTEVEGVVQLLDLAPTLLSLARAAPPAVMDGRDLLPPATGSGFAYAEYGDMLYYRRGTSAILARCYQHGSSSLDPELSARLERDLEQVRRGEAASTCQHGHLDLPSGAELPIPSETWSAAFLELGALRFGAAAPPVRLDSGELESLRDYRVGYW